MGLNMLLAVVFVLFQIDGFMALTCPGSKITEEMRSYVLKEHNKLRSQLANGEAEASNGLMPRSSNMHELEWDCGLEERAQQWAEYCDFEHSTQEFRNYSGENLYARWEYEEPKLDKKQFEDAIEGWWWEEIKDMPAHSTMDGTPGSVLHFTQMAWAITSKLGCGMAKCNSNNEYSFRVHVICHYGPRGNSDNMIYEEGEPCSKCSDYDRICNGNGLCSVGDESAEARDDEETSSEEQLINHKEIELLTEKILKHQNEAIMPSETKNPSEKEISNEEPKEEHINQEKTELDEVAVPQDGPIISTEIEKPSDEETPSEESRQKHANYEKNKLPPKKLPEHQNEAVIPSGTEEPSEKETLIEEPKEEYINYAETEFPMDEVTEKPHDQQIILEEAEKPDDDETPSELPKEEPASYAEIELPTEVTKILPKDEVTGPQDEPIVPSKIEKPGYEETLSKRPEEDPANYAETTPPTDKVTESQDKLIIPAKTEKFGDNETPSEQPEQEPANDAETELPAEVTETFAGSQNEPIVPWNIEKPGYVETPNKRPEGGPANYAETAPPTDKVMESQDKLIMPAETEKFGDNETPSEQPEQEPANDAETELPAEVTETFAGSQNEPIVPWNIEKPGCEETPSKRPEEGPANYAPLTDEVTEFQDEPIMQEKKPDEQETPGSSCPESKITLANRDNILKKLNELRKKVAAGKFSTSDGTYPVAKEMYKLRWNCSLEKMAQKHTAKCRYNRSENFHKHFYGDQIGETLFARWTLENEPIDVILSMAVNEWVKNKPMEEINLSMDQHLIGLNGNLAQIITARTTEIGCGVSFCKYPRDDNYYYFQFITCNYYPSGQHWGNTNLYESGRKCASDAECTTYSPSKCLLSEGLCERQ